MPTTRTAATTERIYPGANPKVKKAYDAQPGWRAQARDDRVENERASLTVKQWHVLLFLSQRTVATNQQVEAECFRRGSKPESARVQTSDTLHCLCRRGLVLWEPLSYLPGEATPRKFWGLSRLGCAVLAQPPYPTRNDHTHAQLHPLKRSIRDADELRTERSRIRHDLRVNDIFSALQRSAVERPTVTYRHRHGQRTHLRVGVSSVNCWAVDHMLEMGYKVPPYWEPPSTKLVSEGSATIYPDGVCVVGIASTDAAGDRIHWASGFPLFVEYDRGTKTENRVANQLVRTQAWALSGAWRQRFPQLDVPAVSAAGGRRHYWPVTLYVMRRARNNRSESERLQSVVKMYARNHGGRGYRDQLQQACLRANSGPKVALVPESELMSRGLRASVQVLHHGGSVKSTSLVSLIYNSGLALRRAGTLPVGAELVFDLEGAPATRERRPESRTDETQAARRERIYLEQQRAAERNRLRRVAEDRERERERRLSLSIEDLADELGVDDEEEV